MTIEIYDIWNVVKSFYLILHNQKRDRYCVKKKRERERERKEREKERERICKRD